MAKFFTIVSDLLHCKIHIIIMSGNPWQVFLYHCDIQMANELDYNVQHLIQIHSSVIEHTFVKVVLFLLEW